MAKKPVINAEHVGLMPQSEIDEALERSSSYLPRDPYMAVLEAGTLVPYAVRVTTGIQTVNFHDAGVAASAAGVPTTLAATVGDLAEAYTRMVGMQDTYDAKGAEDYAAAVKLNVEALNKWREANPV